MSAQVSEIESQTLLNTLSIERNARAILSKAPMPNGYLLAFITAMSLLLGLLAPKYVATPELIGGIVAVLFASLATGTLALWILNRRLEATIALLRLRDAET